MSQRITPLTRNQLLELEALVRNLISAVAQLQRRSAMSGKNNNISNSPNASSLFPSTTPHSVGDASQQSSAPSTPSSLSSSKMHANASGAAPSAASSFLVGASGAPPQPHARRSSIVGDGAEDDAEGGEGRDVHFHGGSGAAASEAANHPVLRGAFLDVFADPWTATAWRVYDKMLYVVWWSYRPPSCAKCGMQDAWMPSGDVEYQCTFCLSGAGTTRSNAVVEDIPASKEDMDDVEDSGDDDDAVDTLGTSGGGGGAPSAVSAGKVGAAAGVSAVGVGSGAGGGGPIDAYLFFYEWLQRIPLLGPAGSTDGSTNYNANTTTSSGPAAPPASSAASQRHDGVAEPAARPHASSASAAAFGAATSATRQAAGAGSGRRPVEGSGSGGAASGVLLPSREALPMVLRAAYDMSSLLTAPGLPRGTAPCIRAAALYLSLLLHRFVSLFPLFCLAGRGVTGAETRSLPTTSSATAAATLSGSAAASAPRAEVELQWVDVELISALLGVTTPSFFESTEVSLQHLQNIFTVAAAYGVPSVLWHPGRVPGRVDAMRALKDRAVPLCPMPFPATGVSGLSPELMAVVVALELARRVDGQPIAASSSSPAAAAQNAQRIGMWLDALGLYPTRRSYRDPNSFHQHLLDTAPEELAGRGGRVLSSADHALQKNHSGGDDDEEDAAAARKHRVLTAWEQTLTGLAAAKDASLLAAAERHARRHDANADSASAPSAASSSAAPALTTPTSPFHKRFEWILTSPCANALLHVFAAVFRLTPMELADTALRSGLYGGSASGFVATLRTAVQRGSYDVMPLSRRLSPLTSSWMCAYMALHSGDRLPLLTALRQLNDAQNSTRDRQGALTRLVQRILRKQQAPQLYQFNYVLRVTDEVERHFNGVYFLSSVLWQEGLAIFTCLRSGRKTITLNRHTRRLSLCYMNAKEKLVERLDMHVAPPVVVAVETEAARQVLEVAVGAGAAVGGGDPWGSVVRSLDRCARVRRRMRVPMLASRLDALASIREQASAASRLQLQQFPASAAFFGGAAAAALGPTLRGWGDTETLLSAAQPLDVQQLRRDLQWNFLVLPHVSLLCGLSENRVVALYASLVGLLELLHRRLAGADAAVRTNWVEELLYVDDDVEDGADYDDGAADTMSGLPFAGGSGVGGGVGWSSPHYRNSRPGTPKLLRSPKSKFIAVSASTNASYGASAFANGSSSAMGSASSRHSAFQHGSSSTSGTYGGRPRGPSPPLASARQPYTMTPPSIAPSRSPVLRTNSGAGPRNASATTTTTTSYHNAVATPTGPRLRTPPLTIASVGGGGGAGAGGGDARSSSPVPAGSKKCNSSGSGNGNGGKLRDAWASGGDGPLQPLPELELAESTANVAKRKTGQPLRRRKRGRAGGQDGGNDDDEDSSLNEDEEDTDNTAVESDAPLHRGSTRGSRASPRNSGAAVNASETERARSDHDAVLRLLRYAMPAYWEVLLGTATDLALAARATSGRGGAGDSDDDDDDAEEVDGSGTHMHSTTRGNAGSARRRRRTSPPEHASRSRGAAGAAAAPAGGAHASEAQITHTSFTVFDAEECRRRLQRVYAFIAVYEERKAALMQFAAEGKLPPAIPAPPPPPQQQQEKAALSAGAATTPGGRARVTSPHSPVRLSPPPPLPPLSSPPLAPKPASSATPTLGGKHSAISGSSVGTAAHAGGVQRSPPHAGRQPTPSPPIRPAVGSPPGSHRRARGDDSAATTAAARRENTSPSPTPSSVGSTSDMSSRRSPRPSTAQRHQGQPQLQQQQPYSTPQRASGRLEARGSKGPDARRRGTSDAADAARAGAAGPGGVVEEADFALPPSEVAWQASKARYSGTLSPVRASRRVERASEEAAMSTRPSSTYLPAKSKLADSQDSSRSSSDDSDDEELQRAAAPECEPASSSEVEMDENEERDEDDGGRQRRDRHHRPPQRKRGRTAAAHASDDDDVDDADGEMGDDSDGLAAPLRRKTKKTGRRRRRLEQHQQPPPPPPRPQRKSSSRSTSRSPESAPSQGGGSGSRSPEQRVRPHPTSGGTSPPLTPSPATGPRGGDVGRKGKLSSPATPAQAVPSIRARPERLGVYTAAAPRSALGASPASSPASSERSSDYDADTN